MFSFVIRTCRCGTTLGVDFVGNILQASMCPKCHLVAFVLFGEMNRGVMYDKIEEWWRENEEHLTVFTDPALNYPVEPRRFPLEDIISRVLC